MKWFIEDSEMFGEQKEVLYIRESVNVLASLKPLNMVSDKTILFLFKEMLLNILFLLLHSSGKSAIFQRINSSPNIRD